MDGSGEAGNLKEVNEEEEDGEASLCSGNEGFREGLVGKEKGEGEKGEEDWREDGREKKREVEEKRDETILSFLFLLSVLL